MSRPRTAMTDERFAIALTLARRRATLTETARRLNIPVTTLKQWAAAHDVTFTDGRKGAAMLREMTPARIEAARSNAAKATAAAAEKKRLPLNHEERRRYDTYRDKCRRAGLEVSRDEAFVAIGRADLAEGNP